MELRIGINERIGGISLMGGRVEDKDTFFRIKGSIEEIIGLDRILGNEISYKSYHPFGQSPLHYNITDTIRGSNLVELKGLLKDVEGLTITIR